MEWFYYDYIAAQFTKCGRCRVVVHPTKCGEHSSLLVIFLFVDILSVLHTLQCNNLHCIATLTVITDEGHNPKTGWVRSYLMW